MAMEGEFGSGGTSKPMNDVGQLKDDLRALRSTMSQLMDSVVREGKHTANRAVEKTADTIKQRPLMMVLLVFMVGLLLGRIFMQRSS